MPLAVLIGGLLLSAWLGMELENRLAADSETRFQRAADGVSRAVAVEVRSALGDLSTVAAFATAHPDLDHATFHTFLTASRLLEIRPEVRAVAFAPHLTEATLSDFFEDLKRREPARRQSGYPPFSLVPPGPREDYFPAFLVEPPSGRQGVVGYDMASNPHRLDAFRRAFKTGQPQASGPVRLSQDAGKELISVLLTAPVFKAAALAQPDLVDWADMRGVVAMGYTPALGIGRVLPRALPPGLAFTLYGDGEPEQVLYDHPAFSLATVPDAVGQGPAVTRAEADLEWRIAVGGRMWTLAFSGCEAGRGALSRVLPWLLAGSGALAALLLALLTRSVLGEGRRLRERVAERTHALTVANQELDTRRREAESANKAKSDFLALMSHELRTPLTAILGFSEMIRDQRLGPIGTEYYATYAADIHSSGAHLLEVVSEILDLARIEAGRGELSEEPVDLGGLVEEAAGGLTEWAEGRGLTLRVMPPAEPIRARVDRRKIKQLILNLVSNAIKFTPGGGRVSVGVERDRKGRPAIIVRDSGIGMSQGDIERALETFTQIDSVLSRTVEGSGLGLPLVRALAELHGGTLELTSQPGQGTTATVFLPLWRWVSEAPPTD
ncbi:Signal transduction histidine kinase [Roseospirillum parvum]|uniref:histidine kinase n=1 Tax=Roseospirillum parvum TaxID=83401 RepID=A0A1G8E4B8_9PROT|nr:Signal transduction histidine kinase [Roseospirillum parvum]